MSEIETAEAVAERIMRDLVALAQDRGTENADVTTTPEELFAAIVRGVNEDRAAVRRAALEAFVVSVARASCPECAMGEPLLFDPDGNASHPDERDCMNDPELFDCLRDEGVPYERIAALMEETK